MMCVRLQLVKIILCATAALCFSSCRNNLNERYHEMSRRCGVQADFPWELYHFYEIRNASGQVLEPGDAQNLSIHYVTENMNREAALPLTTGACVLVPQGQTSVLEILDYAARQYFIGRPPVPARGELATLVLQTLAERPLEPACGDELIYSKGFFQLSLEGDRLAPQSGLKIEALVHPLNDGQLRSTQLLLNQTQSLPNHDGFKLKFEASGRYLVSLQTTNPFGEVTVSRKQCQLSVLMEKPTLVLRGLEAVSRTESHDLPVHAQFFPDAASPDYRLFVCKQRITGSSEKYCQHPSDFTEQSSLDFPEGGSFWVSAWLEDRAGNRSDTWERQFDVDALPPDIQIRWNDADLKQFLAAASEPRQYYSATLAVRDDVAPAEFTRDTLRCQIEFETKDRNRLAGDWVMCRSGRCAGKFMGNEVPCDEELTFGFSEGAPWHNIASSRLILKVSAADTIGRRTTRFKQILFDPANMSQWQRAHVRSENDMTQMDGLRILDHFRDQQNRMLVLTTSGVFFAAAGEWKQEAVPFRVKGNLRYLADRQHVRLWALTEEGLYEYMDEDLSWNLLKVPHELIQGAEVVKRDPETQDLWIGSLEKVAISGQSSCSWDMTQVLPEAIYPTNHQALRDLYFTRDAVIAVTNEGFVTLTRDCKAGRFTFFPSTGLSTVNDSTQVHTDIRGRLWAMRPGSVEFLNKEGEWEALDAPVPSITSSIIEEDDEGRYWFGNSSGFQVFQKGQWLSYNAHTLGLESKPSSLKGLFVEEGRLWFREASSLLQLTKPRDLETIYKAETGELEFKMHDGKLWLWGPDKTLISLSEAGAYHSRIFAEIVELKSISAIFHENDEISWVAGYTINGKRALYERKADRSWFRHEVTEQLKSEIPFHFKPIRVLYRDRQGHMWIATESHGIARFDGKDWTYYYQPDPYEQPFIMGASSIIETDEGLLFGGDIISPAEGHLLFDGQKFSRVQAGVPPESRFENIVQDAQGRIWGLAELLDGTRQLLRYEQGRWSLEMIQTGSGIDNPQGIGISESGDLWILGRDAGYAVRKTNEWIILSDRTWDFPFLDTQRKTFHVDANGYFWFVDRFRILERTK